MAVIIVAPFLYSRKHRFEPMSMTVIDSHAHIQFAAYDVDRDAVVSRARAAGVGMVNVGTRVSTSRLAIAAAEEYGDGLWATVGFHPSHATADAHHDSWELAAENRETFDPDALRELARHPKVVAIGECGLDYYRGDRDQGSGDRVCGQQIEIFQKQIEIAKEMKKPLVVHCRQAFGDLIAALAPYPYALTPQGNGVVHFFSGSWEDAKRLMDLGFFLGFGGVITFAREYDEVIGKAPLERILVETDAPYVAPAPYRGKRNEPAYIVEVVKKIAELKSIGADEVAAATTANAKRLFGI